MSGYSILFLLFVFLEVFVIVEVSASVGVLAVLIWLILMVVAGISIIRSAVFDMRAAAVTGVAPLGTAFKILAGIMLMFPGFISDSIAVLMLIPFIREIFSSRYGTSVDSVLNRTVYSRFRSQSFRFGARDFDFGSGRRTFDSSFSGTGSPFSQSEVNDRQPFGSVNEGNADSSSKSMRSKFAGKKIIDAEYEDVEGKDGK